MSKTLSAILLALTVVCGTAVLRLSGIATAATDQATDVVEGACEHPGGSPENLAGEIFFLAQMDKKYKCLERCSEDRSKCEKDAKDKNKPGTKGNWEDSGKCQGKYQDCLDKCE
jgi:hypothetical protein